MPILAENTAALLNCICDFIDFILLIITDAFMTDMTHDFLTLVKETFLSMSLFLVKKKVRNKISQRDIETDIRYQRVIM